MVAAYVIVITCFIMSFNLFHLVEVSAFTKQLKGYGWNILSSSSGRTKGPLICWWLNFIWSCLIAFLCFHISKFLWWTASILWLRCFYRQEIGGGMGVGVFLGSLMGSCSHFKGNDARISIWQRNCLFSVPSSVTADGMVLKCVHLSSVSHDGTQTWREGDTSWSAKLKIIP